MATHVSCVYRILFALLFAIWKHRTQVRKMNRCMPFVFHPIQVAMLLFRYSGLSTHALVKAVVVALLHDVLEDTNTSVRALRFFFGSVVADAVRAMTKNPAIPTGAVSKMPRVIDKVRRVLETGWHWLRLVELADRLANLMDIPLSWSSAKVRAYCDEAEYMLDLLGVQDNELCEYLRVRIAMVRAKYPEITTST